MVYREWASLGAQRVKHLPAVRETWASFLGGEDPLEEEVALSPVFLPGKSPGQRSLAGCSPQGCKERDTTERLTLTENGQWTLFWRCFSQQHVTQRLAKRLCFSAPMEQSYWVCFLGSENVPATAAAEPFSLLLQHRPWPGALPPRLLCASAAPSCSPGRVCWAWLDHLC